MTTIWKLDPNGPLDCLIVDDDPSVIDTLKMYCEDLHLFRNIIVAEDGHMATTKMSNQKFALILIDLNMPKKDGIKLLKDFSSKTNINNIDNVVIVSGELDQKKLTEAISMKVKNFITKPFSEEVFQDKVRPALNLVKEND